MFKERFLRILSEEGGFKDLPPYLRKGSRSLTRTKNLRQVPDVHRTDPTLNQKVENIRDNQSNKRYLTGSDMVYVINKYGIRNLDAGESKQLGTTNIHLHKCPLNGQYYITKQND